LTRLFSYGHIGWRRGNQFLLPEIKAAFFLLCRFENVVQPWGLAGDGIDVSAASVHPGFSFEKLAVDPWSARSNAAAVTALEALFVLTCALLKSVASSAGGDDPDLVWLALHERPGVTG
jgi:hypothetical protein